VSAANPEQPVNDGSGAPIRTRYRTGLTGSAGQAGRFRAANGLIYGHVRPPQHRMDAATHRATLTSTATDPGTTSRAAPSSCEATR